MLQSRISRRIAVGCTAPGLTGLLSSLLMAALPAYAAAQRVATAPKTQVVAQQVQVTTVSPKVLDSALLVRSMQPKSLACTPPADGTRPDPTLVNTDSFVLSRFPLDRVYKQLIATAGVSSPTSTQLYQQMWDSLDTTANAKFPAAAHCDSHPGDTTNGFPIDCPRAETQLKNTLSTKFTPVALFNRFDLTPSDGSTCGEYRIVYAMNDSAGSGGYPGGNLPLPTPVPRPVPVPIPDPAPVQLSAAAALSMTIENPSVSERTLPPRQVAVKGRTFIIFEGALPNPRPSCGVEMCRPIVKFWEGLATQEVATAAGQQALADALEKFYFTGISGFEPVVHANHYGQSGGGGYGEPGSGQIRTNMFVDFVLWQLREFHLVKHDATLQLDPVTVKTNPFFEMFDVSNPTPDVRAASFQSAFPSETASLSNDGIAQISMHVDDKFNAGQSTSQDYGEDYAFQFGLGALPNTFNSAINSQLISPAVARGDLTPTDITRRATTQSCAGCHQLSNGAHLGGSHDPVWPSSRGFVHVDEHGFLSPALWCSFLPARKATLDAFASSNSSVCPSVVKLAPRPVVILDADAPLSAVPNISPSALTISGRAAGPN